MSKTEFIAFFIVCLAIIILTVFVYWGMSKDD